MPIDPTRALGAELPAASSSWSANDVILYHLGLGAGVPATDPKELEYTYENGLKVLPSFGVIPVFSFLIGMAGLPGLEFNPAMLLHGEQDLEVNGPIPTSTEVHHTGKVSQIYDKGKGAVVVVEATTKTPDGETLFVNRFSSFIRGEGGFGGERGPEPGNVAPDREPDFVVEAPTLPQQALLYRLSGDRNPLHVDPSFAAMGGFDKPILHGLCTFGVVCKTVVDHALDGDTGQVKRYQVRFKGVMYPGETIVTSGWKQNGQIIIQATTKERGEPVITNAAITTK